MRVITGSARGRKLRMLEGKDVRPTTDKVKEAVFSAIHFQIPGSQVLDLFAGSGQLGIEALSRGASKAFFVDSAKTSINIAAENIETTGFTQNSRLINMAAEDFLKSTDEMFDIALLDPPYSKGILEKVLPLLEPHIKENGRVICEHEAKLVLPEKIGCLHLKKTYKYGKIELSQYVSCHD
ncbi:MAG: 16S rRNA (guanine(966)-N(2))-methyltransferase RsmD [Oscillospiraceae bacterium]|nr:16S rRNA (guanine(966)-N(2))-methyltransferase RsmD [Oscillospiraceae bacterium]